MSIPRKGDCGKGTPRVGSVGDPKPSRGRGGRGRRRRGK